MLKCGDNIFTEVKIEETHSFFEGDVMEMDLEGEGEDDLVGVFDLKERSGTET